MHHVLHGCVVGFPILPSTFAHVPIFHFIVMDSTPPYTLCAPTSQHRVRCSSAFKQLAKHHWHVTNTPCKAPKKAVEGATALYVLTSVRTWTIPVKKRNSIFRNHSSSRLVWKFFHREFVRRSSQTLRGLR